MAERLAASKELPLFERIYAKTSAEPTVIASALLESLTSLRREGIATEKISEQQLSGLFSFFAEGKIAKAAVAEILRELPSGKGAGEIAKEKDLLKFSSRELDALVASGKGFGEIMREYRLRVDAQELQKKFKP